MTRKPLKILTASLAWLVIMSTAALTLLAHPLGAHELRPTIADIEVTQDSVSLTLFLVLEPMTAGVDLSNLTDTNQSPLSGQHDILRRLSPTELETAFQAIWPELQKSIMLKAGQTVLQSTIVSVEIPPVGNADLPRDSVLILTAQLPDDGTDVTLTWGRGLGLLALRQAGDQADYEAMLADGDTSAALPRAGSVSVGVAQLFTQYVRIGFQHIVPKGLDHILFVLGLFLFSATLRPLLLQVTTFTLAHTLTLALASLSVISVPSVIVEPLIAASITYVAVENIIGGALNRRRIAVVFGFGLLHGLGFASVLSEVGLQPARFITGLIGFNVGVELGQLAVLLAAFLLVGIWAGKTKHYRTFVTIPASAAIGLTGAYWFVSRAFF